MAWLQALQFLLHSYTAKHALTNFQLETDPPFDAWDKVKDQILRNTLYTVWKPALNQQR